MATPTLQSKDHRYLLDIIDTLRSQGLGKYVDLPEIVVCGDQSAGKSSVLEAISGMSFPSKDNLCTRFPTELVLRRDPVVTSKISILPGSDRSAEEIKRLGNFNATIEPTDSQALSNIVEEAKKLMQLSDQKEFSTDTLRVELSGPDQPHLTLVDLPGLFRAGTKEQSVGNAHTIRNMVKGYMKRPRSIILAVVSAKNDAALQEVTELARKLDPNGVRTLGLITKPDCLDAGSDMERSFVNLAQNESVPFRLGWHVLKNRSYEMRNASLAERNEAEQHFFSKGVWASVDRTCVGVASLKPRLSAVLKDQIMRHLPTLMREVESQMSECKNKLERFGMDRVKPVEQRRYLLQITQDFQRLMRAAIDGVYNDVFFSKDKTEGGYQKRLRAVVQNTLSDFERTVREEGQALVIIDEPKPGQSLKANQISRTRYLEQVKVLMRKTRGCELPGTFNPAIIGQLFVDQCQPWRSITADLTSTMLESVSRVAHAILDHIAVPDVADAILHIVNEGIERFYDGCNDKVSELLNPHEVSHPITYNSFLTDRVRKVQSERQKKMIKAKCRQYIGRLGGPDPDTTLIDFVHMSELLDSWVEVDMELHAASVAVDYMQAYYEVARNKFTDDVAVLAVEHCLINKLPTLLGPETVFEMSDDEVARLVEESEDAKAQRARYTEKFRIFEAGLRELKLLDKHRAHVSSENSAPILEKSEEQDLPQLKTDSSTTAPSVLGHNSPGLPNHQVEPVLTQLPLLDEDYCRPCEDFQEVSDSESQDF